MPWQGLAVSLRLTQPATGSATTAHYWQCHYWQCTLALITHQSHQAGSASRWQTAETKRLGDSEPASSESESATAWHCRQ